MTNRQETSTPVVESEPSACAVSSEAPLPPSFSPASGACSLRRTTRSRARRHRPYRYERLVDRSPRTPGPYVPSRMSVSATGVAPLHSTMWRVGQACEIARQHYEPGNQARSLKQVWRRWVNPTMGICYHTFLRYLRQGTYCDPCTNDRP